MPTRRQLTVSAIILILIACSDFRITAQTARHSSDGAGRAFRPGLRASNDQVPPPAVDMRRSQAPEWVEAYREPAARLIGESIATDAAWQRLAYLGDKLGSRLSGSPNLDAAIRWAVDEM